MLHFDGKTYEPKHDHQRLSNTMQAVKGLMLDGKWRTLSAIQRHCAKGTSTQSVSARLRDLRKARFGGYTVERRRVDGGLFEYRVHSDRDLFPKHNQ